VYWHPTLNTDITIHTVGRAEEIQCFFYRRCLSHLAFQSPKSILDNNRISLHCRICGLYAQPLEARNPSQYESAAYLAVKSLGLAADQVLVEIRILKGNFGAVDIWLRDAQLLVMVDGESYFVDAYTVTSHDHKVLLPTDSTKLLLIRDTLCCVCITKMLTALILSSGMLWRIAKVRSDHHC
jgi:hypothetical protein